MKKISTKKGIIIFYVIDFILLAIIAGVISLLPKKNSPKSKDSVILNTKYLSQIDEFQITDLSTGESISLKKNDIFWYGTVNEKNDIEKEKVVFPCDMERLSLLIEDLSEIKKITLLTSSREFHSAYGISSDEGICLQAKQNGNILTYITFGKEDTFKQKIPFKMENQDKIYDAAVPGAYLTTDRSFWCDPYIQPVFITGNQEESERSLRRGRLTEADFSSKEQNPDSILRYTAENGNMTTLYIKKQDDTYIIRPSFTAYSTEKQKYFSIFNYSYRISQTTYNGLKK
ncbi:MAG: hypothetical protein J6O39_01420 [Treponema sp.]|nr:hypothetical protein [Treponema sp.]